MDVNNLKVIADQLTLASGSAQRYGPFFFSILFVCIIPTGLVFFYRRLFSSTENKAIVTGLYKDFRIYFHVTVAAGLISSLLGTGWWIFSNYMYENLSEQAFKNIDAEVSKLQEKIADMQDKLQTSEGEKKEKKYIYLGDILATSDPNLEFDSNVLEANTQLFFARSPYSNVNRWIFLVVSNDPIAAPEKIPLSLIRAHPSSAPELLTGSLTLNTKPLISTYKVVVGGDGLVQIVPTD